MGLREKKAARTRREIVDAGIELFLAQGYDQTTIEQIAERAEVGTSTLYRYFAGKDLILLEHFAQILDLAPLLRARPSEEPIEEAMTAVLQDSLNALYDDPRTGEIRSVIDNAPIPRARLWDVAAQSQHELVSAIADRLGRSHHDVVAAMTAHMMLEIYGFAGDTWWAGDQSRSRDDVLNQILLQLHAAPPALPAPLDPGPAA